MKMKQITLLVTQDQDSQQDPQLNKRLDSNLLALHFTCTLAKWKCRCVETTRLQNSQLFKIHHQLVHLI